VSIVVVIACGKLLLRSRGVRRAQKASVVNDMKDNVMNMQGEQTWNNRDQGN